MSEYHKKYYQKNKQKMLEERKEKVKCQKCGIIYTKGNKTNHGRTKKHSEEQ